MTTQEMINRALANSDNFVSSSLGMKAEWLSFDDHNNVQVMISIWGNKYAPVKFLKTRATFYQGSQRISRALAEEILELAA